MAREFVMGARITLRDNASGVLGFIRRNTDQFAGSMDHARGRTDQARNSLSRFTAGAKSTERSMRGIGEAAARAKEKIFGLKEALVAIAAGATAKKGFDWLVMGNANIEQYQNTLTVVMGSQQKAIEQLQWAQKFAVDTPFEIPQVVEATVKMQAYGLESKKTLGIVGDMASVMGKSLDQAVEAIADAQTGELERLKEFGITKQMIEAQAKGLGSSPINNQGQITDQVAFNAALFALMEKRFKGGMEIQSRSFKGMLSNAADFMGNLGRQLGQPLFDKAKAGLQDFLNWTQRLKDTGQLDRWIKDVQQGFSTFGTVVKELTPLLAGMVTAFVGFQIISTVTGLVKAYRASAFAATVAQHGFNTALRANPIGLVVTAIGLLVTAGVYLWQNWDIVKAKATAVWKVFQNNPILWLVGGPITMLIGAVSFLIANWGHLKESALDVWASIKNAFIDGVNVAIDTINRLIDAINLIPGVEIGHINQLQHVETAATRAARQLAADQPDNFSRRMLNGSHATGLSRVPFDGYIAELHRDERILTAAQARRYDAALGAGPTAERTTGSKSVTIQNLLNGNIIIQGADKDSKEIAHEVIHELYIRAKDATGILSRANLAELL